MSVKYFCYNDIIVGVNTTSVKIVHGQRDKGKFRYLTLALMAFESILLSKIGQVCYFLKKSVLRDIGKFRNLALALLVWMYVKQQGADSKQAFLQKPAAPSLELRTTLNLTHGRHLPLASKIGWRYCPPLFLQCTALAVLCSASTSYYILLLRTSNVKQNEDWQHKFTRRIVRHC